MAIIEIDTDAPCTTPRPAATERLEGAVFQIAHELATIQGALRKGAVVSDRARSKLNSYVLMLRRLGLAS